MFYKNARICCGDFQFRMGAFEVLDGRFGRILPDEAPPDGVDLHGATVIPGLVEIHSHGNSGTDFSDGDYEGLKKMAAYFVQNGVTSFAPASMTLPYEILEAAFRNARRLAEEAPAGLSVLRGIHMEGPWLSEKRRGAQNREYLKDPNFSAFRRLFDISGSLIKIVDVAPELPGALDFIREASKLCTVSIAHSDADYDLTKAAIAAGAGHLTHLFNAMPGIHHREPGQIVAALESPNVRAELICDGHHVHPAMARLTFSLFGPERMVLISDSGRCAGLPDGTEFLLGGQTCRLSGGVARLPGGAIACSAADLRQCLRNVISWGIGEGDAVRAASLNPARAIGAHGIVGSIEPGKQADFIITDENYEDFRVFLAGRPIDA